MVGQYTNKEGDNLASINHLLLQLPHCITHAPQIPNCAMYDIQLGRYKSRMLNIITIFKLIPSVRLPGPDHFELSKDQRSFLEPGRGARTGTGLSSRDVVAGRFHGGRMTGLDIFTT
ncbi:hypothetical protein RRG08_066709 [Elysia crispata]|uniref:Uncharacterized protein n=1 Tax=Elysia crispata TaxID=231223 RepID=A0AAE1B819_9GAST|nr:hypothetical protein RRG08_066709 [Elysia crispata]